MLYAYTFTKDLAQYDYRTRELVAYGEYNAPYGTAIVTEGQSQPRRRHHPLIK